jgi:carboxypeptidase Q
MNHAVLYVRDAGRTAEFYETVLGFLPVTVDPGRRFAFLRAPGSSNHHDIAFFTIGADASPSPAGRGAVGLYHIAWEVPTLDVECEDYGLLARLAENGQGPEIRVNVDAEFLDETPTFNTIAMIRGSERPDEYVLLSAHLDTWSGATGATDNGTGTITMMEAMRILSETYPQPRRTIIVGHWGGEEQGLNGSAAFAEDHPEILEGMQVVMNQDNGTGRIVDIGMQGFLQAGGYFARWLARVPGELSAPVELEIPGLPDEGRSDHASFVCHGVPSFRLGAHEWDYRDYTWHTNRDTFDKISIEEVRGNAILTAMLAYLASEEPELMSREKRELPVVEEDNGQRMQWPECREPMRSAF